MNRFLRQTKSKNQYAVSIVSVTAVSLLCLLIRDLVDYKVIGYLLLVTVSLLAIFLEILPVLIAATLSALILDFLFIKPYYNLQINSTEDLLLLLLFFVIALVNAVLTFKIRRAEQIVQVREARLSTMKLYNILLDSLSHELRTPIATIMGGVGALQEKSTSMSGENTQKLLSEMEKASLRLNHQVENLLNMSRLESGYIQPKLDWCDISELIYNVIDSLKEELMSHKINVSKPDYLPLFRLDYGLTEQIIYNIVYNASQYTPKGSSIQITIEYKPEVDFEYHEDKQLTCNITIADDGYGFPEAEIAKAFDRFYRVKDSKTGGTGLGLSIVKGFTEAQDGKITLQNREEGGAMFKIGFAAAVMHLKGISNE
ncbi:sensor histidine kinase [Flavobacterium pallidum]|uniref:histidine kinase n=1 Tax=Flavobacterium pallidum TaxID=2172098 RepID=A0A2S1SIW5_9FLAO|nr:ATP-binding protein [Flavobacterium pallidum]AWI26348.1 sensor histidine kinase [Flavobacterium pallidum]